MGRKFFVGGNWKCNGTTEEVKKIVNVLNEGQVPSQDVVEVVISPPFVFLPLVKSLLKPDFHVAAQNCWVKKGGAFTGEVSLFNSKFKFDVSCLCSAEMLVNLGIPWVILGHSERRLILNESNEFVGDKVKYALSQGIKVIACVGETLEQRESGSTVDVVAAQTKAISERVSDWSNIVLAYEPVWAIGTGKVATPAQAQEVHSELRKWLHANTSPEVAETTRIIYGGISFYLSFVLLLFILNLIMAARIKINIIHYMYIPKAADGDSCGKHRKYKIADISFSCMFLYMYLFLIAFGIPVSGSVNGANCKELAAQPDVDGFLVGGASLKPEFIDIIKSAEVKKNA
ncbi:hypothetical protein Patl1_06398 [Pistacia atlantica]|uniref:Uncharacterized protein n=1 Tax=Pistacia atlantica TaxID=434234 RepID=A0ACC1BRY8_9ROSI|nr:hypothetical protein Patl1_06398 [Pistacia atlantica]